MSASNSLAKKRRAPASVEPQLTNRYNSNLPPPPSSPSAQPPQQGLTLQQVINVIDGRLTALERTTHEIKTSSSSSSDKLPTIKESNVSEEYNSRFEMLFEEITNLKDIVLNLQAYTLKVNKVLFDEKYKDSLPPPDDSTEETFFVSENQTVS
jgi:hypothetical protein